MAKLLSGNSNDIIKLNQQALKKDGLSEAHSMHLALKHANKDKAIVRVEKKIVAKPRKPKIGAY